MKLSAFGSAAIAAVTLLLFPFSVQAAPLTVPNHSFESPVGVLQSPDNWTGDGGTGNNTDFSQPGDGAQYLYMNPPAAGAASRESNASGIGNAQIGTYTLTVALGNRNDGITTDGSYVVELLSAGNVIGSHTVNDPYSSYAIGSWNDISVQSILNAGDPALGGDLTIRLITNKGPGTTTSANLQGQFDNVRLDFIPASNELGPFSTDFESASTGGDIGDGWQVWINQFTNPGDVYDGGYAYNGGNAPAAGPQVSFIVSGQGGAPQGSQQMVVFSDYGNGHVHGTAGSYAETNVFQQQTVGAIDVGRNWTFTWDAKKDNLAAPSTAFGFIKHFDSSFNVKQEIRTEMTAIPTTWDSYSATINLADAVAGDIIQIGFSNWAGGYNASAIFYDNVNFFLAPPTLVYITNPSGQLTGAENVWVNGAYYNVSFVDGTCADLFTGCDDLSDFTFPTLAQAYTASQGLLDQVLLDTQGYMFDSDPDATNGCSDEFDCLVLTPFGLDPGIGLEAATVVNNNNINYVDDTLYSVTWDTSGAETYVYAVWTPAMAQEVQVPLPVGWFYVLAPLLAGLGIKGVRRKRKI